MVPFCEEPQAQCACHRLLPGEGALFVTGCRDYTHELLCTSRYILEALVGPCHSGSCFLHKHRRAAVIIKPNWLLNVLYITGLSNHEWYVSVILLVTVTNSFLLILFLKPSTSLFRIKACFVILFFFSSVPFGFGFQGCAKEKCTHMDGVRIRGWLVSVGNINAEFKGRNNPSAPAVWLCTLGWSAPLSLSPASLKYTVTCTCTLGV